MYFFPSCLFTRVHKDTTPKGLSLDGTLATSSNEEGEIKERREISDQGRLRGRADKKK